MAPCLFIDTDSFSLSVRKREKGRFATSISRKTADPSFRADSSRSPRIAARAANGADSRSADECFTYPDVSVERGLRRRSCTMGACLATVIHGNRASLDTRRCMSPRRRGQLCGFLPDLAAGHGEAVQCAATLIQRVRTGTVIFSCELVRPRTSAPSVPSSILRPSWRPLRKGEPSPPAASARSRLLRSRGRPNR